MCTSSDMLPRCVIASLIHRVYVARQNFRGSTLALCVKLEGWIKVVHPMSSPSRYGKSRPLNLMVPGHAGNPVGGGHHLAEVFGDSLVRFDIPLMLDGIDLGEHTSREASQQSEPRPGVLARVVVDEWCITGKPHRSACCAGLGERVLMQRSSHSSFTDGVLLAGPFGLCRSEC